MESTEQRYAVVEAGHSYLAGNMDGGSQTLTFIKKRPVEEGSTELVTVINGTTNEAVLEILINRLNFLHAKLPSRESAIAITKLEEALLWLEKRTAERKARGVEGTNAK